VEFLWRSCGELVINEGPGRQTAGERTMACNLGLALDDMAVASRRPYTSDRKL
jgi:hypothetical protein